MCKAHLGSLGEIQRSPSLSPSYSEVGQRLAGGITRADPHWSGRLAYLTLPAFSHPPLNSVDASQLSRHSTCPEHSPRPPTRLLRLGAELPPNTQTHHRSVPSRGSPHPPPPNKPSSSPPGSSMGSLGICELLPGTEGRDPTALTTCNPRMNAWGLGDVSVAEGSGCSLLSLFYLLPLK